MEVAQHMAGHESARTMGLHDRRGDQVNIDEGSSGLPSEITVQLDGSADEFCCCGHWYVLLWGIHHVSDRCGSAPGE